MPGPDDDFIVLVPPNGTGTALALGTSESALQKHPRVHLDLYVDSAAEQAAEVESGCSHLVRSRSTGISIRSPRTSSFLLTPRGTSSAWSTRATDSSLGAASAQNAAPARVFRRRAATFAASAK